MSPEKKPFQAQLQQLLDLDVSRHLEPEQRLCLAILRQAVLDYFGDTPHLKQSAADYFDRSAMYLVTLKMFNLPDDLLPIGVDLGRAPGDATAEPPVDPLRLETLVNELSGTQLKVMLTLGLLALPASAGTISKQCRLNRSTVLKALAQLADQGLVMPLDTGLYTIWTVPAQVRQFLDEVWVAAGREAAMPPLEPDEPADAPAPRAADSAAE
jgi:hypothetical protein